MKTYFSLLDGVRFFAAVWVMNFHYFFGGSAAGELHWYRYGSLGVQLFFIVSGFVIIQSMDGKNVQEFIKGRFIRLFPLFWILCTFTYLLTLIVPGANPHNFNEYAVSMTMFGDVINGIDRNDFRLIDPSYWTLTVEFIFYLAVAFFTYIFSYKNIRFFLFFWLIFSLLAFLNQADHNVYIKLALVRHSSYFIFGGALALIIKKQANNLYEKYFDWGLLFLSAGYSMYIHPKALTSLSINHYLDTEIILGLHVLFFSGILILVFLSKHLKNTKIINTLAILGGLTYPLYLLHQTIGDTLINFFTNNFGLLWNNSAIIFELIIIVVAYFVFIQDKKMRLWLNSSL